MSSVPFTDLAFSIQFVEQWLAENLTTEDEMNEEQFEKNKKKMLRLFKKIQEHVIVTNPQLYYGGAPNQLSLIALMSQFHDYQIGSREFWQKCVSLLENLIDFEDEKEKVWMQLDD